MRTLLVVSQKGGVGKTTTAINLAAATAMTGARVLLLDADPLSSVSAILGLAQHPRRQTLRQAGIDLPGVLARDVLPCLDVLSPYDDNGCSDEALDHLLTLVSSPGFRDCYGGLIVNTPPFLGPRPRQLLATCDSYLLVMRAEPMAHRTYPALQELLVRSQTGTPIKLAGILLTLPEGEHPGARWERELRGRFGSRVLPPVVPYDEAVVQETIDGLVTSHARRDSEVANAYHGLAEHLQLTAERMRTGRPSAVIALKQAAVLLRAAPTAADVVAAPPVKPSRQLEKHAQPAEVAFDPPHELPEEDLIPEPVRMRLTPTVPIPAVLRPAAHRQDAGHQEADPPVPVAPAAPLATPVPPRPNGIPLGLGLMFMLFGIVVGVGLRFVPWETLSVARVVAFGLSPAVVPYLVGVGVAVMVLLVLISQQGQSSAEAAAPAAKPKPAPPVDRQEAAARRLNGLARHAHATNGRHLSEN
ncbi:MAG: ParA family protein [Gemmataceae bacterium]